MEAAIPPLSILDNGKVDGSVSWFDFSGLELDRLDPALGADVRGRAQYTYRRHRTEMKARDVMSKTVVTVPAAATIVDAAKILLDHGVSGAPVVDGEGRLVGMLTEGDLFRRYEIGTEPDPAALSPGVAYLDIARRFVKSHGERVEDVMTRDVVRVFEDTPLARVAELMGLKRIKRVPVVRDGEIVGIVSRADLLRALVDAGSRARQN
jgi:CBS domain-containing protein